MLLAGLVALLGPVGAAAGAVLFDGGHESGTFAGRWSPVSEPGPAAAGRDPSLVRRGRDPVHVFQGSWAAVHVVPAGARRSELQALNPRRDERDGRPAGTVQHLREGDDRWFGGAIFLPRGFAVAPTGSNPFQVLAQWKYDAGGSPPVSLSVAAGRWQIEGGAGHPLRSERRSYRYARAIGVAQTGRWTRVVVHIRFSARPAEGLVEAWLDGRKVLGAGTAAGVLRPPGGTMYPHLSDRGDWSEWRVGLYRNPEARYPGPGVVYTDAWRLGTRRSEVEPGPRRAVARG